MKFTQKIGVAATCVAVLGATACGSDSLSTEPAASAPATPAASSSVNAELGAKLPQKVKDAGMIVVGTDASYAPNEFLAGDGKTVQGMDVDLFNAVAAKLGVKAEFQPASFDSIITGVQGGKFDLGVSSFTINDDRKKQVNMVSYFEAGTLWATAAGNPKDIDPENACGKTVAVQTGTVQEEDDLPARQKACGSNKIKILPFEGQDQATAAVVSGRADAMLADSPVVTYAITQTSGKLAELGEIYDAAPYGYVVPKAQTEFAQALADALTEIESEGGYQAALAKWKLEGGGIDDFAVNP